MGISNFLNSLFGKAKVAADEVLENVEEFTETASKKIEEMHLSEKANEFVETAKVKASEASDWAEEKAHEAKDAVGDIVDKVEDKIKDLTSKKEDSETGTKE